MVRVAHAAPRFTRTHTNAPQTVSAPATIVMMRNAGSLGRSATARQAWRIVRAPKRTTVVATYPFIGRPSWARGLRDRAGSCGSDHHCRGEWIAGQCRRHPGRKVRRHHHDLGRLECMRARCRLQHARCLRGYAGREWAAGCHREGWRWALNVIEDNHSHRTVGSPSKTIASRSDATSFARLTRSSAVASWSSRSLRTSEYSRHAPPACRQYASSA